MSNITRRAALVGAAAAGAAGTLPTPASAQAAASGRQAAGYYRYKIGDFEVTAINDGVRNDKLERSPYPNAKVEDVQAALRAHFMPTDQLSVPFNVTLVNTGSKLVLIDTGNGPGRGPTVGLVAANLAAAGVDGVPSSRRTRAVNFRIDLPVVSKNSSAMSEAGFAFKE